MGSTGVSRHNTNVTVLSGAVLCIHFTLGPSKGSHSPLDLPLANLVAYILTILLDKCAL